MTGNRISLKTGSNESQPYSPKGLLPQELLSDSCKAVWWRFGLTYNHDRITYSAVTDGHGGFRDETSDVMWRIVALAGLLTCRSGSSIWLSERFHRADSKKNAEASNPASAFE